MHNMLRSIGIVESLDEQIGAQFIDNRGSRFYSEDYDFGILSTEPRLLSADSINRRSRDSGISPPQEATVDGFNY